MDRPGLGEPSPLSIETTGIPHARGPAATTAVPRRRLDNLPIDLTSFVGRRRELADARRLLAGVRLLTLTGVGGVGKTRLALRMAGDLRRAFPDGVWLVEFAELEDGEPLAEKVGAVFGVESEAGEPLIDALTEFLTDKRMLLVLDNCEHLLDDCAALAVRLLSASQGITVLCTSRQALGITGEYTYSVPSLELPEVVRADAASVLDQYDAVGLFVERATAVLPGFAVTAENCGAVVRVCQQLDGIPLAIELAAARLKAFSVDQILDRLGDRYRLLTAGNRIALPRQRTLRALIDWSFGLCADGECLLWARLSVFAGGFDLAGIEAVCGEGFSADEVFELVAGLVDKSVVIRTESGGAVRYRMLETIRQYGRDRLAEEGGEDDLRRRHRDWFLTVVKAAEAGWSGPGQVAWIDRIRVENGNLRLALDFCVTEPGESEVALEFVAALCDHRRAFSSLGEARRWLDRALALTSEPTLSRAKALTTTIWIALLQGDKRSARVLLEQCRSVAAELDCPASSARVVQFSGLAEVFDGNLAAGIDLLQKASELFLGQRDRNSTHLSYGQMTMAMAFSGHPEAAWHIDVCLAAITPETSPEPYAFVLWYLAVLQWREGELAKSAGTLVEALQILPGRGDRLLTAYALETLAWVTTGQRAFETSARLLGAAESARRAMGCAIAGLGHLNGPHQECEGAVRQEIGDGAFDTAYRRGAALGTDEAVALVFQAHKGSAPPAPREPEQGSLTRRERQIAELVEQGMSNKEIASTLVIAQRTAETHVEHILSKLGFHRRAQIAAWSSVRRT
jgi:predicted ATPase/DNA-binding CsgD family transcriptional regulator